MYANDETQQILKEAASVGSWTHCFYFYGLSYEQQSPGTARLHIVVHSNYLSGNSYCTLEIYGPDFFEIPLYFSDGKCVLDLTVTAGAYHATFYEGLTGGEIPDAEYGSYRDFDVLRDGYYEITYLLDQEVLGVRNVAAWIRAVRWLPRR